jgi:hypothetical protein
MSKATYRELRQNPPSLTIKEGAKEIIITTISAMCDNVEPLRIKKNADGEFKMSGMGYALSNWQMKSPIYEIEWMADEGEWDEVLRMINSGTSAIEKIMSR